MFGTWEMISFPVHLIPFEDAVASCIGNVSSSSLGSEALNATAAAQQWAAAERGR